MTAEEYAQGAPVVYSGGAWVIDRCGVAWESTTPAYIKYVTQERYLKFSDEAKRWYKPYRCSCCTNATKDWQDILTEE